jgi:phosphatidylserine/phosphatidylglycerophosphate/cardiolipin synthase-like enzyme
MATNLLDTGTASACFEAARQIACLPDVDISALVALEDALLLLHHRDQYASIQALRPLVENRLSDERVEAIFLALTNVAGLLRHRRDRRGAQYDQYQIDPERLRRILNDAILLRQAFDYFQDQARPSGQVELIATLPDTLPLPLAVRREIPSLATTLHRLITNARQEVIILNPFFEQEGFDRLAAALLAAARRGVAVITITRELSDVTSANYRILKQLWEQSLQQGVAEQCHFYEYHLVESGRILITAHAKVMIVDRRTAYVGSANLTEYGMNRFIEIGVALTGVEVRNIAAILEAILNAPETKRCTWSV